MLRKERKYKMVTDTDVIYKPPVCPECGEPILRVEEVVSKTYWFDEKAGTYTHHEMADEIEIRHLGCGADLLDTFEQGVCNYSAKEEVLK